MMSSNDLQLPRDPGPVPVPLRDAFAWARDAERTSSPGALPDIESLTAFTDDSVDDDARCSLVERLLGSTDGARELAQIVAAKSSVAAADEYFAQPSASNGNTPRAFVGGPISDQRRRALSRLKPFLLAASLLLVASTSWYVYTRPPVGDEVRAAGSAVELFEVPPGAVRTPITLRWRSLRSDARYSVEVLDASDTPVFAIETNATTVTVPASTLSAGTYRWYVRSRASDRTEVRSRVESFILR